jgi:hypothetical protein
MEDAINILEDCITKLEHLADDPFLEPSANAAWCASIAVSIREALEALEYE